MSDLIRRQDAIDALNKCYADIELDNDRPVNRYEGMFYTALKMAFERLPSAQPEPAIPLQWIEAQIEWLKSLDNAFSTLTAGQISAMVNKWEDEQDG